MHRAAWLPFRASERTAKHSHLTALCIVWLAAAGCTASEESDSGPTKDEVSTGKADLFGWCSWLGAEPGCDLCAEMGWYEDGDCDATLVAVGTCHEPDPDCDSPFCFYDHIDEAIAINEERRPLYAALTNDESLVVSNALLRNERLARPVAVTFDMRAQRWQRQGIDIICDELVPMALTPELARHPEMCRRLRPGPSRVPGARGAQSDSGSDSPVARSIRE